MDAPRRQPIHVALQRPILLAGGERELVMLNAALVAALVMTGGFTAGSLVVAGLLATVGHWGLVRAARLDPQMRRVYQRHVRYQNFYPARATEYAPPAEVLGGFDVT
ncbi:MAG: conjugal transfer protein TrbD [Pseudomonadota bacterium]|nr:conjugal transfer protein TrbD [Pseudomonadota bacterium]